MASDQIKITSVHKLVSLVSKIKYAPIYRGHSDETWKLSPSIARNGYNYSGFFKRNKPFTQETEKNFLHRFKRRCYNHQGRVMSNWEALFLARHHGLPVRLLDWTASPLIALYFACESDRNHKKNGAIWVFKNKTEVNKKYEDVFCKDEPFSVKGIRLIFPFYSSPRMIAQSSIFTIHSYPWPAVDKLPASYNEEIDIDTGQKWLVPQKCKEPILRQLCELQFNTRTLFPDLDGIAKEILNTELVFRNIDN